MKATINKEKGIYMIRIYDDHQLIDCYCVEHIELKLGEE